MSDAWRLPLEPGLTWAFIGHAILLFNYKFTPVFVQIKGSFVLPLFVRDVGVCLLQRLDHIQLIKVLCIYLDLNEEFYPFLNPRWLCFVYTISPSR